MATAGYDYVLSGFKWANPARITYSLPPDGVFWDHGTNVLNATFNAKLGGSWQREVARALATWQAVANINIAPVADGPYVWNNLGQSQGDPKFGDIRIGGYAFTGKDKILAQAHFPPPQGATAGGDVEINTSMSFQINGQYDLYSVLLHETGHSLGLKHSVNGSPVMGESYGGIRPGLTDADIAGIQAIYGARQLDAYQGRGVGLTANAPIDLTGGLASTNATTISTVSLTRIGDAEWFSFVAPAYASGSLSVTAGAAGVSMLSPAVAVFDASMNLLAKAGDPSAWSSNATAGVSTIVPGQRYFVSVQGATNDVFSVGAYQLTVAMPSANPQAGRPTPAPPPPPPPVQPTPTPTPPPVVVIPTPPVVNTNVVVVAPDRFEGNDAFGTATRLGRANQIAVTGLTLDSADDYDYFVFQNAAAGTFQIVANGAAVQVLNPRGGLIAQGIGSVSVTAPRNASVTIRVSSANGAPLAGYGLSISGQAPVRQAPSPRSPLAPRAPLPPRFVFPSRFAQPRYAQPRFAQRVAVPPVRWARFARLEIASAPRLSPSWDGHMRIAASG